MSIQNAYSSKSNIEEAVKEIKDQFGGFSPSLLLFFCSSNYNPEQLGKKLDDTFSGCETLGCTTAGEITSGKMLKNSVVAMGLDNASLKKCKIEVIKDVSSKDSIKGAFSSFESFYGVNLHEMDIKKYIGIILIDGLSGSEEKIMDTIGDITNIRFVGGSAGDDLKFQKTYVFANGNSYNNAAVVALLEPNTDFDVIKTQSFCVLDKKLKATKVNEESREVLEFNNKPASEAYAEAVGSSVDEANTFFMKNPVGLVAGDEPFVRSPQQIKGNSVVFYCNIMQGMEVNLLESTDMIKDTKASVDNMKSKLGGISGIINFHCILRTLDLEAKGLTEAYGKIFSDIPTIGFSTYGEEYIGHINQTSTMIVFK